MYLLQFPNEILDEIFWKMLDYEETLFIRPHRERLFSLTKYMEVCKKFRDIIRKIIERQQLRMVTICNYERWIYARAIELNNNRMIITRNEYLKEYIYEQIEKFAKESTKINNCIIRRLDFKPQEYQKWKSEMERKRYKRNKDSVDEKQSSS
jgi:hypothetical protein